MLIWAAIFLIIAIIAGIFGFGKVANVATGIAKILFVIFLILFIISVGYHVYLRSTMSSYKMGQPLPQQSQQPAVPSKPAPST